MTSVSNGPVRHVIVFLVDGMRPDGLQAARTPFLDQLREKGAHTFGARSVMPTTTLPCHTSLFFSVPPEVHGIRDNTWQALPAQIPGLFDVLHHCGLSAASFYNWEELRDLSRPGLLKASFFVKDSKDDDGQADRDVSALACSWLGTHEWSFAFVYFHNTDKTGHGRGWMSASYLDAIANADRCIQEVCGILPEGTMVIVTSDHGGHENTHHSDLEEDMVIPLIMCGPGIPRGEGIRGDVSILDIAPTVVCALGIEKPDGWLGKEIRFSS
jgi:predicted AlkP superfamily pyrophosphatase or phosphodiesterase